MAASLVASLQFHAQVSAFSNGGDSLVESSSKSLKDSESAAIRWRGPRRAIPCWDHRLSGQGITQRQRRARPAPMFAVVSGDGPGEENNEESSSKDKANSDLFRQQMEDMIMNDAQDARFEGKDLAQLIRNKYGRSYDVQLIKKEFMGRQLLAMNVMWKYREQRSFPLTEEEYLLHLDYIAQNLRGWGAVSVVRASLEKTRERPRIGKAVSIFINPDESGERAKEWIQR